MAKLQCICGHIIVDQTDNIPYKGYLIPDTEIDKIFNVLSNAIDSLSVANRGSKRLDWIKANFTVPPYPIDLNDSSMIHDIVSSKLIGNTQNVFECEVCGRIAVEIGNTNLYKFYKEETNNGTKILK